MTKSPEERYLEWLDREEENLGADFVERATFDVKSFRDMLKDELTPEALGGNIQALIDVADIKYRQYPEIGVTFVREKHAWGQQPIYRDSLGHYTSVEKVTAALEQYRQGKK